MLNGPSRRVIDVVELRDKLELLKLRLVELYPVVDYFLVLDVFALLTSLFWALTAPLPPLQFLPVTQHSLFAQNAEVFQQFMDKIKYMAFENHPSNE